MRKTGRKELEEKNNENDYRTPSRWRDNRIERRPVNRFHQDMRVNPHTAVGENDSQKSGQRNQPPVSPLTKTNLDKHEETIQIQDVRQFGPTPQQAQKEQRMERTPYSVSRAIPFIGQQQKPKLINTEIRPEKFHQHALKMDPFHHL